MANLSQNTVSSVPTGPQSDLNSTNWYTRSYCCKNPSFFPSYSKQSRTNVFSVNGESSDRHICIAIETLWYTVIIGRLCQSGRCMPPLRVFDHVMLLHIISSWKDCFRKIILSLILTQIYSKHALNIVFQVSSSNFTSTQCLITWSASFKDVITQFPTMDNSCLINDVVIIKRNTTKDKSTRAISYLSLNQQII